MANKNASEVKSTATVNVGKGTEMNADLLANMATFVRNATEGTRIRVSKSGKTKTFVVMSRFAHRGRTGRTILTLNAGEGKEPLKVGAMELLQAFGEEVFFQPSATPVPVGTRGIKPRTEAEVAEIAAKKEADKVARKAVKAVSPTRVEGPPVPAAAVVEAAMESDVVEVTEEPSDQTVAEMEPSEPAVEAPEIAQEAVLEALEVSMDSVEVEASEPATEAPVSEEGEGETRSIADLLAKYAAQDVEDASESN